MKLLLIVLLLPIMSFAQTAKIGMLSVTIDSNSSPERLSETDLIVRRAQIIGASNNSGLIFIGTSAASAVAANGVTLTKGTVTIPGTIFLVGDLANNSGSKVNLKDIWAGAASNGDKVNVFYVE